MDRHGCSVFHGLGDVVNVDVIAKHILGVFVHKLHRGTCESDESGVGQSAPNVVCKPVAFFACATVNLGRKSVLASVRLVYKHDHVLAPREYGKAGLPLRPELLNGAENHAPHLTVYLLGQIRHALDLLRLLTEQLCATPEGRVQLAVQIVAVGQDQKSWVLELRLVNEQSAEKRHEQAFSRSLSVPDHTAFAVARHRSPGARQPLQCGMVLMVACRLLDRPSAVVLKHRKTPQHVQHHTGLEQPLHECIQRERIGLADERFAVHRPPRHEAIQAR